MCKQFALARQQSDTTIVFAVTAATFPLVERQYDTFFPILSIALY